MSAQNENIIKGMMSAIKNVSKTKTSAYDTTATVTRVEDATAWVHIPGGIDETPVSMTMNAKAGDVVRVRVSGGRAWIMGNSTAPPTDDTKANIADKNAVTALEQANAAQMAAATAERAAESAVASAAEASTAAAQAIQDASDAARAAGDAQTNADAATRSASSALLQLGTIEDVVGTLNWISQHGTYKPSEDEIVEEGKLYFVRSGEGTEADPYVYTVVTDPSGDPSSLGYYELDSIDEAVSNYVRTHLALTDAGLYVTGDANGWRVLVANDSVQIIDELGNTVATYGSSIFFNDTKPQRVGGTDAYVEYYDSDNDGKADAMRIVGTSITLENGRDVEAAIDGIEQEIETDQANIEAAAEQAERNRQRLVELGNYINIVNDILRLSATGSPFATEISNTDFRFLYNNEAMAWMNALGFNFQRGVVQKELRIGNFLLKAANGRFDVVYDEVTT